MSDLDWTTALGKEMAQATLPDPRLNKRLGSLVEQLARNPELSFPKVFSTSELEGAYRFFGHPFLTPDVILSGHFEATRARCQQEKSVWMIHDTTKFSFCEDGQRRGLGRLSKSGQTFFAHASLALSPDGTRRPLGVAAMKTWVRSEAPSRDEHTRWIDQIEVTEARFGCDAELIHITDREGDDYERFAYLLDKEHRFIIRALHDRLLDPETSPDAKRLKAAIAQVACTVERDAKVSKRVDGQRSAKQKNIHPSRQARLAQLSISATRLTFQRPRSQDTNLPATLSLNTVRVWEPEPPTGEAPIEWILLTTESIATTEDILRIVEGYRARWTIEEFFKAIKSGCAYEKRQLEDYEGLLHALAIFAPIACQLLWLRSEARRTPDSPAHLIFPHDQIEVLRVLGRIKLPPTPSTRDILLAIAALGGHIKSNGNPGWQTLIRGYAELLTLTRGWHAAKLQYSCVES